MVKQSLLYNFKALFLLPKQQMCICLSQLTPFSSHLQIWISEHGGVYSKKINVDPYSPRHRGTFTGL